MKIGAAMFLFLVVVSWSSDIDSDELINMIEITIRNSFQAEAEGRFDDSLSRLESGNASIKFHPIVLYRKAKLLMHKSSWSESLSFFSKAATKDPQMPGLFSHIAYVFLRLNETANARRSIQVAARNDRHDLWIGPLVILASRQHLQSPLKRSELAFAIKRRDRRRIDTTNSSTAIVTAANSLYFGCVGNMIGSAQRAVPHIPVILYDIGLTEMEKAVASTWSGVHLRRLDLAMLPPHVSNIRNKAWKPLVTPTTPAPSESDIDDEHAYILAVTNLLL